MLQPTFVKINDIFQATYNFSDKEGEIFFTKSVRVFLISAYLYRTGTSDLPPTWTLMITIILIILIKIIIII
jgi:hypothetical protein